MNVDKSERLAELVGIVLGDGSFYIRNGFYQLDIAFNKSEANYTEFVEGLLRQLVNCNVSRKCEKTRNCMHLRISNKTTVLDLLKNTILVSGNKIANQVSIPQWVWQNDLFLKACLRGLIDTDGSLYRLKPHWPNLFQLSFKNNNKTLLTDAREAFVKLGFHPSKLFGNRFVITRQREITKYLKEIGTHNN